MPIIESSHRHAASSRKAMEHLKQLTASLGGWNLTTEKDGVKLFSKVDNSNPFGIVRGDTILKTTTLSPADVAIVAAYPGCRKIWDEKFDQAIIKETFTRHESLFWVKVKTPWPVSARDFTGITLNDFNDDVCYVCTSSVVDDGLPPVSGCVRGTLLVSGWKVFRVDGGIGIIYVTQVDLAGSIPTSFLKNIQRQTPLCAGRVAEYVESYGFPPRSVASSAEYKSEAFDHNTRAYEACIYGQEGDNEAAWYTSGKMYPNGIKVEIVGSATHEILDDINGNKTVIVKNADGAVTVKISKA